MKKRSQRKGLLKKLRDKYRLSIYRDESFEEVLNFRLSRLNILAWGGISFILLVAGILSLIAFTNLKELLPGVTDQDLKREILSLDNETGVLKDSLSASRKKLQSLQRMFGIAGDDDADGSQSEIQSDAYSAEKYDSINLEAREKELEFRRKHENQNKYAVGTGKNELTLGGIAEVNFFPPVNPYLITGAFNLEKNHYGIDLACESDQEEVKATLSGTVILAAWTLETGWVIEIQHDNNLISVYKHNATLLKGMGDYVEIGEAIAIVGNTGEHTTGPHLHFEIWFKGTPLNPEEFISF